MSKMTMPDENQENAHELYMTLKFVEFLEIIGRVAHVKFQNSEL